MQIWIWDVSSDRGSFKHVWVSGKGGWRLGHFLNSGAENETCHCGIGIEKRTYTLHDAVVLSMKS
jgi:hypothetical protein